MSEIGGEKGGGVERAVCLWRLPSNGEWRDLRVPEEAAGPVHVVRSTGVPLGRSAGETAPGACVETPDCGGAEEEPRRGSRSRWSGCPTGCRPRCSPSWLSCQP